jgi:hypothetical protein
MFVCLYKLDFQLIKYVIALEKLDVSCDTLSV